MVFHTLSIDRNTRPHAIKCREEANTGNRWAGGSRRAPRGMNKKLRARSLQWWTTTRRPQRRPDFRQRRHTRLVGMVGLKADHFLRPIRRAPSTCIVQAPQPQQQPQPRTQQSPATSRPQLARSPLRPRFLRSPCPVPPRSTTVP